MWMSQSFERSNLGLESIAKPLRGGETRGDDLHGHIAMMDRIVGAVDRPHAAVAEEVLQFVGSQGLRLGHWLHDGKVQDSQRDDWLPGAGHLGYITGLACEGNRAPARKPITVSEFYSFDGIDGTGKSTQTRLFAAWLRDRGRDVVTCRDPGTTPVGESLRDIVLHRRDLHLDPRTESLIYMAARAQLVADVIRPALARGATVVSDRFLLANVVYQGYGLGVPVDELWTVGRFATGGLVPTCVFLLDLPPQRAYQRRARAEPSPMTNANAPTDDRMEARDLEYFAKVREGFLLEARRGMHPVHVVDASGEIDAIQAMIRRHVEREIWRQG